MHRVRNLIGQYRHLAHRLSLRQRPRAFRQAVIDCWRDAP